MHTLTRQEEEQLLTEFQKRARKHCDPAIKAFADCATGRTVSVIWACRPLQREMNACLKSYGESGELERMKLELLRQKRARAAAASQASTAETRSE
ncbi:cytochrome c oxidase biogenesis protein Cmc1 like-domain-containing protein [Thamnocephalis sphaerospora]|uniref:COX assembly mitochondrial protein n=1 Tax=Thamnocephalis sphaerospora TaxID=78915 RepID=A0A4V1IVW4_9FUNG|nr:cytochrome c oxidase biogenesis protein Cmc1 like-domain-containing protein [Thamnocephalis sphaerospora]|eukprot:RKP05469.1 cytochrome c oxidase biogenesis protein Cmc1 like-domain-containing protein [Thamnocephalis sphaerospora]